MEIISSYQALGLQSKRPREIRFAHAAQLAFSLMSRGDSNDLLEDDAAHEAAVKFFLKYANQT